VYGALRDAPKKTPRGTYPSAFIASVQLKVVSGSISKLNVYDFVAIPRAGRMASSAGVSINPVDLLSTASSAVQDLDDVLPRDWTASELLGETAVQRQHDALVVHAVAQSGRDLSTIELERQVRQPVGTVLVAADDLKPAGLVIMLRLFLTNHAGGRPWDKGSVPFGCIVALENDYNPSRISRRGE
jgi:hypothetical protein